MGELGQTRGVAADNDGSILAHELHELDERSLDLFERAVVIKMIGLNVGDNHHIGVEIQNELSDSSASHTKYSLEPLRPLVS